MKGSEKITWETTAPVRLGGFDITEKWTYERDNTFEGLEDYIDLFEKILLVKGFTLKGHLDIVYDDVAEENELIEEMFKPQGEGTDGFNVS